MLGGIHRSVLGLSPGHFYPFFRPAPPPPPRSPRRHFRHLVDPLHLRAPDFARRSVLGLVSVYNLLPDSVVAARTVHDVQSLLQALLRDYAGSYTVWSDLFSCRIPFANHPLRRCRDWVPPV